MCGADRIDEWHRELEKLLQIDAAGSDARRQLVAVDVLHRHEVLAVGLLYRVHGDDVGMIEGGDRLGFSLETLLLLGAQAEVRRQDLQRHASAEPSVLGQVDFPHAASPERLEDVVVTERAANHRPLADCENPRRIC